MSETNEKIIYYKNFKPSLALKFVSVNYLKHILKDFYPLPENCYQKIGG